MPTSENEIKMEKGEKKKPKRMKEKEKLYFSERNQV